MFHKANLYYICVGFYCRKSNLYLKAFELRPVRQAWVAPGLLLPALFHLGANYRLGFFADGTYFRPQPFQNTNTCPSSHQDLM